LTVGQNNEVSANFTGNLIQSAGTLSLTKVGTGTQIISGTGNTYTGSTAVNGGALVVNGTIGNGNTTVATLGTLGGAGTLGGQTTVNGQLDPGAGAGLIGTLTFGTNLTLNSSSTTTFQLDRNAGQTADFLNVLGALTLGGTNNVVNIGAALIAGDLFDLFNSPSISGSASELNLPTLDPGLSWDTTLFATSGIISVITVPEPSSMALAGIAGLVILIAKRRKA
jgi:autotransporter-associated beta strand protein